MNHYLPHRKDLLSADEIRELSQIDFSRALRDTIFDWAQIVAAWTAVAVFTEWWVVLLAIPVIGTARYGHQVLAHDGIHRRLHPRKHTNDWFCDLLLLGPVAAVTRVNGQNHLAHHRLLATAADPDRYKYASANKRTLPEVLLYLAGVSALVPQLRSVYGLGSDIGGPDGDVNGLGADEEGEVGPAETRTLRDYAIILGWQAALIIGLGWAIGWWAYPVLWMLPVWVFMHCADLTRQFLEHAQPMPDELGDRRRLISFVSTPFERWLLSPHNMNHHIAHHLWPSIPYHRLPEADRRARERNRSEALSWQPTYWGALMRYLRALPIG